MVTQNLFYNRQPLRDDVVIEDLIIPLVIKRGAGFNDIILKRNIEDSYNSYDNSVTYSDSTHDFRLFVQRVYPKKCGDKEPTQEKYKLSLTLRSNIDHKKFAEKIRISIGTTIILEATYLEISITSGYTTLTYEAFNLLDPALNTQEEFIKLGMVSAVDDLPLLNPTKYYKDHYSSAQLDENGITIRHDDFVIASFVPKWIDEERDLRGVVCFPIPDVNVLRIVVVTNTKSKIHIGLYHTTSDNSMQVVYLINEYTIDNNRCKDVLRLEDSFLMLTMDSCFDIKLTSDFNALTMAAIPSSKEMLFYNSLSLDPNKEVIAQLEEIPTYEPYKGSTLVSEEIAEVMENIVINPEAIPTMSEDSQEVAKVMVNEDALSDIDDLVLRNDISKKLGEF